jgi:glutathione S-transferase
MKLHWSPRSPFVRKVMIVAHETGQSDRFQRVRSVAIRTKPNPEIIEDSPVGRIPVMVLDDGIVLSGSYHICEYLDSLHDGRKLIPAQAPDRWRELELHGVADGLLDTLIAWRGEAMKPEAQRWQALADTCAAKTDACLDWLERRCQSFGGEDYGVGQITAGIALDYLDFRFPAIDWRAGRAGLETWHQAFLQRDSTKATEIVNDE